MKTNEYVAVLASDVALDAFLPKVKLDLGDEVKTTATGNNLRISCDGETANKLRKYKELRYIRCDVVSK